MKIIDENGAALENPDLTLGWLRDAPRAGGRAGAEPL